MRKTTKTKVQAFLLLLLVAIPLLAQDQKAKIGKAAVANPAKREEIKTNQLVTEDPAYVIGAQDVLDINVWKEPEITRTVPVRPDGKISLPLVKDIQAAGLTPTQLTMLIAERLQKYVADPQVTVVVREINSRRFYILGEVARPGAFTLLPGMTILQALSGAGGFTQFASPKGIYLLRNENGKQTRYPFNYKEVLKGINPQQNLILRTGDTVVVP
jgi:polysaccharide biosynthesis/export protein